MSWIDKIKKIFSEEEPVKTSKTEKILFEQLQIKVKEKDIEISREGEKLRKEISARTDIFKTELNACLENLEKINVDERKEVERLKHVVKENLNLYISQLERFAKSLENIEIVDPKSASDKIFTLLNEFNKKSYLPFEKATILVGKELEETKKTIWEFGRDLNKISESNKTFFGNLESINELKALLDELKKQEKLEGESYDKIKILQSEIIKENEKIKELKAQLKEIVESDEHKKEMTEKEKKAFDLRELEKELVSIRDKTNLKDLAKKFHFEKRKSLLIKEYLKDFKSALKNDDGLEIIEIVEAEKDKIRELKEKLIELSSDIAFKTETKIGEYENGIRKIEIDLKKTESEIEFENKKIERIKARREKIVSDSTEIAHNLFPNIEIE